MNLLSWFLVFAGSGIGGCFRFGISLITRHYYPGSFPLSTLGINLIACLLVGWFGRAYPKAEYFSVYLLLVTGFCGGFSTFSAFGLETIELVQNGRVAWAFFYVSGSVIPGLAAIWIIYRL